MLNWLGQEGNIILELNNWSPEDKQNKMKIIGTVKTTCQPQENPHLYKQQFFLIRQGSQEMSSDLYHEVCHIMTFASLRKMADAVITKTVQPARYQPETSG